MTYTLQIIYICVFINTFGAFMPPPPPPPPPSFISSIASKRKHVLRVHRLSISTAKRLFT